MKQKFTKEEIAIVKAKNIKIAKRVFLISTIVISIAFILVIANKMIEFFRENTIVKHTPIEVKFYKPLEIVSLAELKRREVYDETMTDIANRVIEEYQKPKDSIKITDKGCQVTSQINPKTFFDIIAVKESGNNTNDNPRALHNVCKAKGMYNAIGYSPTTKFCFKDEEEARLYVAYYVKKNCDNKSLESCQCYWNLGKWVETCPYSEGNLSLAN